MLDFNGPIDYDDEDENEQWWAGCVKSRDAKIAALEAEVAALRAEQDKTTRMAAFTITDLRRQLGELTDDVTTGIDCQRREIVSLRGQLAVTWQPMDPVSHGMEYVNALRAIYNGTPPPGYAICRRTLPQTQLPTADDDPPPRELRDIPGSNWIYIT
jgi:hypothetical protein